MFKTCLLIAIFNIVIWGSIAYGIYTIINDSVAPITDTLSIY